MARKYRHEDAEQSDVDMTPMLDIVFILLIFFIVTTSFVREEGLLVNRPKANKAPSSDNPMVLVRIGNTGLVTFNGKQVDIERLAARIESFLAKNETTTAVVIPSYDTTHSDVVKVIDEIKTFDHLTVAIGK